MNKITSKLLIYFTLSINSNSATSLNFPLHHSSVVTSNAEQVLIRIIKAYFCHMWAVTFSLNWLSSFNWTRIFVNTNFAIIISCSEYQLAVYWFIWPISMINVWSIHSLLPNTLYSPTENTAISSPFSVSVSWSSIFVLFSIRDRIIKKFVRAIICSDNVRTDAPI